MMQNKMPECGEKLRLSVFNFCNTIHRWDGFSQVYLLQVYFCRINLGFFLCFFHLNCMKMMKGASKASLPAISERPPAVITQHLKFAFILIILIILQDIWKSGRSAANGQTLAAVPVRARQMGRWCRCPVYLLSAPLVRPLVLVVDATEVGDDDGDGQSDHQHPAEGANGAEDLAGDGLWHHVSISVEGKEEKSVEIRQIRRQKKASSAAI